MGSGSKKEVSKLKMKKKLFKPLTTQSNPDYSPSHPLQSKFDSTNNPGLGDMNGVKECQGLCKAFGRGAGKDVPNDYIKPYGTRKKDKLGAKRTLITRKIIEDTQRNLEWDLPDAYDSTQSLIFEKVHRRRNFKSSAIKERSVGKAPVVSFSPIVEKDFFRHSKDLVKNVDFMRSDGDFNPCTPIKYDGEIRFKNNFSAKTQSGCKSNGDFTGYAKVHPRVSITSAEKGYLEDNLSLKTQNMEEAKEDFKVERLHKKKEDRRHLNFRDCPVQISSFESFGTRTSKEDLPECEDTAAEDDLMTEDVYFMASPQNQSLMRRKRMIEKDHIKNDKKLGYFKSKFAGANKITKGTMLGVNAFEELDLNPEQNVKSFGKMERNINQIDEESETVDSVLRNIMNPKSKSQLNENIAFDMYEKDLNKENGKNHDIQSEITDNSIQSDSEGESSSKETDTNVTLDVFLDSAKNLKANKLSETTACNTEKDHSFEKKLDSFQMKYADMMNLAEEISNCYLSSHDTSGLNKKQDPLKYNADDHCIYECCNDQCPILSYYRRKNENKETPKRQHIRLQSDLGICQQHQEPSIRLYICPCDADVIEDCNMYEIESEHNYGVCKKRGSRRNRRSKRPSKQRKRRFQQQKYVSQVKNGKFANASSQQYGNVKRNKDSYIVPKVNLFRAISFILLIGFFFYNLSL